MIGFGQRSFERLYRLTSVGPSPYFSLPELTGLDLRVAKRYHLQQNNHLENKHGRESHLGTEERSLSSRAN